MKPNFRCPNPKCRAKVKVGKQLHAQWTCPNCKNSVLLKEEDVRRGYIPFRKNAMFDPENRPERKPYERKPIQ